MRRLSGWFPLTNRGAVVLVASVAMRDRLAVAQLDYVALVASSAAMLLTALAAVAVLLSAVGLAHVLQRSRGQGQQPWPTFEAGKLQASGFRTPCLRWLPWIRLRWQWHNDEPRGTDGAGTAEEHGDAKGNGDATSKRRVDVEQQAKAGFYWELLRFHRRGPVVGAVRTFRIEDVLGLARVRFDRSEDVNAMVKPQQANLSPTAVEAAWSGGADRAFPYGSPQGDPTLLRRYIAGDPARFIHWRTYARTGKLAVRSAELSVDESRSVALFFMVSAQDAYAAAAAQSLVRDRLLPEPWTFGVDGLSEPTAAPEQALQHLMLSARYEGPTAGDFSAFAQRVMAQGSPAFVVIGAAVRGDWLARVAQASQRLALRPLLLLAPPASRDAPNPRSSRLARLVFRPTAPSRNALSEPLGEGLRADLQRYRLPWRLLDATAWKSPPEALNRATAQAQTASRKRS